LRRKDTPMKRASSWLLKNSKVPLIPVLEILKEKELYNESLESRLEEGLIPVWM